jgi:hypothetical protein
MGEAREKEKTINSWFGLESVSGYIDPKLNRKVDGLEVVDSDQLIGIEVELEKSDVPVRMQSAVWSGHADGSLRNSGLEWITRPIPARDGPAALYELFRGGADSCCFTPRTSIHVHFDCTQQTKDQVLDVVLLYLHFEKALYNFVGKNRIRNIYCVPINETVLAQALLTDRFDRKTAGWKKYTGLNLLPLRDKGTLEFRHMHGTNDVRKVSIWIRLIIEMFQYCHKVGTKDLRARLASLWTGDELDALGKEVWEDDYQYVQVWRSSISDIFTAKQAFTTLKTASSLELETYTESPFALFKGKA